MLLAPEVRGATENFYIRDSKRRQAERKANMNQRRAGHDEGYSSEATSYAGLKAFSGLRLAPASSKGPDAVLSASCDMSLAGQGRRTD